MPLLTPHSTVIAVDNGGAGDSQRPLTGYGTETMAIALENPAPLAQAYLDFFAGG